MSNIVHVESTPSSNRTGGLSAIWIAGLAVLLLWSLASAGFALLLIGGGDFLASQAAVWSDQYPQAEKAVSTGTAWLAHYGTATMWFLWGFGAVLIVFGTWLAVRCVQALQRGLERLAPRAGAAWDGVRQRLERRGPAGSGGFSG